MFSLENFYPIVYKNLLEPIGAHCHYFKKFGSVSSADLISHGADSPFFERSIVFYDQEPLYSNDLTRVFITDIPDCETNPRWNMHLLYRYYDCNTRYFNPNFYVLANSEHSEEKNKFLNDLQMYRDWYYFFHGFAALDWFKNVEYLPPNRKFTKIFICFNNLFTEKRSYRLNLIARLREAGIANQGHISLGQHDTDRRVKHEVFSPGSQLSVESKKLVIHHVYKNTNNLVVDNDPHGAMSACDDLDVLGQGLFHLVTETIFYDAKLHLTEKIFKPIVARRPFLLVGAPGNLAYLKSYGFKTFDRWIDESYDHEPDPDRRIQMIVNEMKKLCNSDIDTIYAEMQEILDYNFDWFYNGFKQTIVNEMVDNFRSCILAHDAGLPADKKINCNSINYQEVKSRLAR